MTACRVIVGRSEPSWSQNAARLGPASYLPWRSNLTTSVATRNFPIRWVRYGLKFASLPTRFTSVMLGAPSYLAWTRPDRRMQATARYQ